MLLQNGFFLDDTIPSGAYSILFSLDIFVNVIELILIWYQMHMQTSLQMDRVCIVIPRTQIPMWINKQNVGSSMRMDPSPHDKNWIGVAYCLTFVAHDDPTSLGTQREPYINLGFQNKKIGYCYPLGLHHEKDLVTVGLDHLMLIFSSKEQFITTASLITKRSHDSGIDLTAFVGQPLGLHIEVKNCGYRWIFKEDLEQLNQQMMYSGSSSI